MILFALAAFLIGGMFVAGLFIAAYEAMLARDRRLCTLFGALGVISLVGVVAIEVGVFR